MSHFFTLENGLRVHLVPYSGTGAATLLVLTKVGSRYEYAEINGASHFIEHLMFKGTKRRPNTVDISRTLDAVGAEYNAYTGKDLTGYHVTIDAAKLDLAVDMLHDMLFHSKYDKKELDRERNVIIEEINMYTDNPMMHVEELLEEAMFEGNTLGWSIAGSHKTMRTMSRDAIIAFRDQYYVPSRMVIVVAGKVDESIKPLLNKTFGKIKKDKETAEPFVPFAGVVPTRTPRVKVQNKKTQQIQVALGFPSFAIHDKRNPALSLMSVILGGSMSSRLFISVRERRGLAYFVRSGNSPYEDTGVFTIQSGLDQARLPLALKTIRQELALMKKKGVTARELKEAKDHIRGKMLLRLEDSSERAEYIGKQELYLGEVKSFEERMKEFAKVTPKDVQAVANEVLDERRMSIGAVGPYKNREVFMKAAGL